MFVFRDDKDLMAHVEKQMEVARRASNNEERRRDRDFANGERNAYNHILDCLKDFFSDFQVQKKDESR